MASQRANDPNDLADTVPLRDLRPGQRGWLTPPANGAAIPRRLQDLGFVPGTAVAMVRRAPLGDPVELELRGYRLCLRLAQLRGLRVAFAGPSE